LNKGKRKNKKFIQYYGKKYVDDYYKEKDKRVVKLNGV